MKLEDVRNITILGTGMMGPGIAVVFARAGYDVVIWGTDEVDAKRGVENFKRNVQDLLDQGLLSSEEADSMSGHVSTTVDLTDAARRSDFICEAVLEDLELKQDIFAKLDEYAPISAVVTSTTSTLSPTRIAEKMKNKSRMMVAHFWNPAYLCPLVEVCGNTETSPETAKLTMDLLSKVGNRPVLLKKEVLGFIGNRLMHAMNREAISMIQKGIVTAEDVDNAVLSSFGPRFANIGPMEYLDFVGLDLVAKVQDYLHEDLEKQGGIMTLVQGKIEGNELGMKSGVGFFDWSRKNPDDVRARRDREFMRRLKESNVSKA